MRIAIVAGEASGDLLGAGLIASLQVAFPDARFEGIAGPRMQARGCATVYPMDRLSVMGLFESFGRYPELIPFRHRLAKGYIRNPPDVFIGVDAPDFNLSLELSLRQAGIPTVHYVSPSVWAWRRYRIAKIKRAVDLMLTLFPFEADFYQRYDVPVAFVGHPLADEIPLEIDLVSARRALRIARRATVVALLPGSRMSEVEMLAEPFVRTAHWLHRRRSGIKFLVPLVGPDTIDRFRDVLGGTAGGLDIEIVAGRSRDVMAAADVVLAASGTATLEALLLKKPMVIAYRTMAMTWFIGKRLLHVDHVGLPNLLAGRRLVPELLQDQATPERMGAALLQFLELPELCRGLAAEFQKIHAQLRHQASQRAVAEICTMLGDR